MKVKEIINLMTDARVTDEKHLYYMERIKDTLCGIPEGTDIRLSAPERFAENGGFMQSLGQNRDIEKELNEILISLRVWLEEHSKERAVLSSREQKKSVGFKIFAGIFVAAILVTLALTLWDIFGNFEYGGELSIAFDGVGLMTGLAFFLYERHDDSKKKDLAEQTDKQVEETLKNYNINVNGNNNSVNVYNGKNQVINNHYGRNDDKS